MSQNLTLEQLRFARSIGAVYCVDRPIHENETLDSGSLGKPGFVYRGGWKECTPVYKVFSPYKRFEIDFSPLDMADAADNQEKSPNAEKYPKYFKNVSDLTEIDVYAVHNVFGIDDPAGCIQHASKKLLLSGVRTGGKSKHDDIREARDTLNRWLEINNK